MPVDTFIVYSDVFKHATSSDREVYLQVATTTTPERYDANFAHATQILLRVFFAIVCYMCLCVNTLRIFNIFRSDFTCLGMIITNILIRT